MEAYSAFQGVFNMIINIMYFIGGVGIPYFAEEYAYQKLKSGKGKTASGSTTVSQEYGWRIIWDAAYFFVLLGSGYRLIFSNASLSWFEWLGYFAFLCGVVLRIRSLNALGRFYDSGIAIQTDHQLVRSGPYRILRHPLHVGTLLKIIGLAFFSAAWLALPAALASLLVAINLNRTEDRIHLEKFGASFKEYYLATWDVVDLFFWKKQG
jgi:protein-S-isoprenylcysteine O-methyltransferase